MVKGAVYITVAGESCTLKEGQIAVINGFESHSYEIDGEAEIFISTWERITYAISSSCIRIGNCRDGCLNASRTQPLSRKSKSDGKRRKVVGFKENGFRMLSFADIIDFYGLILGARYGKR